MTQLENWKCSVCGENITEIKRIVDYSKVEHNTFFEIERSKRELFIDDNEIVEKIKNRNVKMNRLLCEGCFVKVLNESKTLGNLFLYNEINKFVY